MLPFKLILQFITNYNIKSFTLIPFATLVSFQCAKIYIQGNEYHPYFFRILHE